MAMKRYREGFESGYCLGLLENQGFSYKITTQPQIGSGCFILQDVIEVQP
jgi:hypothetical protein